MPKLSFHSVHHFFQYDREQDLSVCKVHGCERQLPGRHAGNLSKHLKKHPELYTEFLAMEDERRRSSSILPHMTLDHSHDGEPANKMAKIETKPKSYVTIQMDQSTFLDGLITLCSVNGHPFSIADDSGMRQIIDPICRAFRMNIDSTTIALLVQERANHIVQLIRQELSNRAVCLKIDIVRKNNTNLIGVSAQFTESGVIHSRMLAASELNFTTHAEFSQYVTAVVQKYDIDSENIFTLVVDNLCNAEVTQNLLEKDATISKPAAQNKTHVIADIEQKPFEFGKVLCPVPCASELFHSAIRQAVEASPKCGTQLDPSVLEILRAVFASLQSEIFLPSDFFALWTKTSQDMKKIHSECASIFYSAFCEQQNLLSSNSLLLCATYLDPRFRMLLSVPQLNIAKEYIIKNIAVGSGDEENENDNQQATEEDDFEKLLIAAGKRWPCESNGRGQIRREIDCYETLPHLKRTDNPVIWWNEQTSLPLLKDFSLAVLSLPVTQFSTSNLSLHFPLVQASPVEASQTCQPENVFLIKVNSQAFQNVV